MLLDLKESRIRATLTMVGLDRARFTITYPRGSKHEDRILVALAKIISPTADRRTPVDQTREDGSLQ
jgi:hypothetical protein